MRKILITLMALGFCMMLPLAASAAEGGPSAAKRAIRKIGVGFTHVEAPLGVRYWFNGGMFFDGNFGFALNNNAQDVTAADPNTAETQTTDFNIDLGLGFAVWRKPGSQSHAFARLGYFMDRNYEVGTASNGNNIHSSNLTHNISGMFGIEWFLAELGVPQLALQAAVGINIAAGNTAEQGGNSKSSLNVASFGRGPNFLNATFGFHYYFF